MKKSIALLVVLCVFLLNTACKKDDGNNPTPSPSKKDLISKNWKVDQVLINNVEDKTTDHSSAPFQSQSDGTYKVTTVARNTERTWELSSNEQQMLTDKGTDEEDEITILLLNETQFHLEDVEPS